MTWLLAVVALWWLGSRILLHLGFHMRRAHSDVTIREKQIAPWRVLPVGILLLGAEGPGFTMKSVLAWSSFITLAAASASAPSVPSIYMWPLIRSKEVLPPLFLNLFTTIFVRGIHEIWVCDVLCLHRGCLCPISSLF